MRDCDEGVNNCLRRLREGDAQAKEELFSLTYSSLLDLATARHRTFPRLYWVDPTDVLNASLMRLQEVVDRGGVNDANHFYALATLFLNWELLNLAKKSRARSHLVKQSLHVESSGGDTGSIEIPSKTGPWRWEADRNDFLLLLAEIPADFREILDLLHAQNLTQSEAAERLGVSLSTVKRRYREALTLLAGICKDGNDRPGL